MKLITVRLNDGTEIGGQVEDIVERTGYTKYVGVDNNGLMFDVIIEDEEED